MNNNNTILIKLSGFVKRFIFTIYINLTCIPSIIYGTTRNEGLAIRERRNSFSQKKVENSLVFLRI